jgi:hypothetical protein
MQKKNLYARLYFFDGRDPVDVRRFVAGALSCSFDEEFAKSDEFGTTWFADALGFEILFRLTSRRDDGAWYTVTVSASVDLVDPEAPMDEIDFHLSQVLRKAGFSEVVTPQEYRERYQKPAT